MGGVPGADPLRPIDPWRPLEQHRCRDDPERMASIRGRSHALGLSIGAVLIALGILASTADGGLLSALALVTYGAIVGAAYGWLLPWLRRGEKTVSA